MNSPHLATSPRRIRFRVRSSHITLAVVVAVHVAAFFLFFNKGEPGGSSPQANGDRTVESADINWQNIDSLVPPPGEDTSDAEVAIAPVLPVPPAAPAVPEAPDTLTPPSIPAVSPEAENPLAPVPDAVADAIPIPIPATRAAPPAEPSMPIMVAKVVEEPGGHHPIVPTVGTGTGFGEGSNAGFDFGAYDLLITKEFHRAWVQPLGVDTPYRRNVAKLSVKIRRDGKVERFSLDRLTGVPELDSSVLAAARSVRSIAPLPDDFHGDTYDVTINFRLD